MLFPKKASFLCKSCARGAESNRNLEAKNYDKLSNLENVTVFNAKGEFHSDTIVKIIMQGEDRKIFIEGKQIFINNGAKDIIPNIKGIKQSKHIFTSQVLMNSAILPKNLLIIGGGLYCLRICLDICKFWFKGNTFTKKGNFY